MGVAQEGPLLGNWGANPMFVPCRRNIYRNLAWIYWNAGKYTIHAANGNHTNHEPNTKNSVARIVFPHFLFRPAEESKTVSWFNHLQRIDVAFSDIEPKNNQQTVKKQLKWHSWGWWTRSCITRDDWKMLNMFKWCHDIVIVIIWFLSHQWGFSDFPTSNLVDRTALWISKDHGTVLVEGLPFILHLLLIILPCRSAADESKLANKNIPVYSSNMFHDMSFIIAWKSKIYIYYTAWFPFSWDLKFMSDTFFRNLYAVQATQYATLLNAFAPKLSQVSKPGTRLLPTKIDTTISCHSETMSLLFIKSHIHQTLPREKNKRKTILQQCAFLLTIRNAFKKMHCQLSFPNAPCMEYLIPTMA